MLFRIGAIVLLVALVLAVAGLLIPTLQVVLLLFAAILFGVFLRNLAGWVAGMTSLSYRWAFVLTLSSLIVIASASCYYLGAQFAEQAASLRDELGAAIDDFQSRLEQYAWAKKLAEQNSNGQSVLKGAESLVPGLMQGVQSVLWAMSAAFVVFFVGCYVAYDPELYRNGLIKLVPADHRERVVELLDELFTTLGNWIVGRLISMALVGALTAVGLMVLGVPLPIPLGVLAALLCFIPNLGPILAAVPQALLAIQVSPTTAVYVIVFNVGLQAVESYLITPMIQKYQVSLPPALTISMQMLLAIIAGTIGMMMAAPLTAAAIVATQVLYLNRRAD